MAEAGALQRLPEWKPAQRVPARGNELVTVQLVQQVNANQSLLTLASVWSRANKRLT